MANTSYLVAVVQQPNGKYTVGCGGCQKTLATDVSESRAERIAGSHRCNGNGR
jgi:hypothetical protein